MPETIQLPVIDTPDSDVKKSFHYTLLLDDDYMQLLEKAIIVIENDDTGIKEEKQVDFDMCYFKKCIAGVSVMWNDKAKKYFVKIELTGVRDDWNLYFNSKQEAVKIKNLIFEWARK